ncbi:MAG TPA: RpiB/LacA/LacB family sugar-phosphate isomerase [Staphylococcus auricularis]|nr:RpiB/LacA/LacB family sugar-phosphate isomerase [Staphylococcus auricularis]
MSIFIHSDQASQTLKQRIIDDLTAHDYEVIDLAIEQPSDDITEITRAVTERVAAHSGSKGIIIDRYSIAPFILANKYKNIICAMISDEQSAKMTCRHNNTNAITLGSETVGILVALNCVRTFLQATYDGGRHQIRIDMLNHLC